MKKNVDLLLLSNSKNPHYVLIKDFDRVIHYVLIKDFDRVITNKTEHHGKKHFCWCCLQCVFSSKVVECHVRNCLAINHTKSIYINFQNFERLARAPFIFYDHFECVLIPSTDNIHFSPNTKKRRLM